MSLFDSLYFIDCLDRIRFLIFILIPIGIIIGSALAVFIGDSSFCNPEQMALKRILKWVLTAICIIIVCCSLSLCFIPTTEQAMKYSGRAVTSGVEK